MHKKLKETAGVYRKSLAKLLMNDKNEIVVEAENKIKLWKTYVEDLFADDSRENIENIESNSLNKTLSGLKITKDEIRKVLTEAKNNKAAGPDKIPVEILKPIEDDNTLIQGL